MSDFGLRLTIGAPVEKLWAALIEPASLARWLNEHAVVNLANGVFDSWGRYAPDGNPGGTSLHSFEPNRSLAFAWRFEGTETSVSIELCAVAEVTELTVRHRGLPPHEPDQYWVSDFWHLALANLANLVEGRRPIGRCAIPAADTGIVRAEIDIEASPHDVFVALTEPDQVDRWFGTGAVIEPVAGGRYDLGWGVGPIKVLEIVPDRLLAYSWNYAESAESVVRWELEHSGGRTQLTLVHSGFAKPEESRGYQLGWLAGMAGLKRMLEIGPGWRRPRTITV